MSAPLTPEQRLALSRERIRLALQEPAWGDLIRWLLAKAAK
jgi:hypothetical protein